MFNHLFFIRKSTDKTGKKIRADCWPDAILFSLIKLFSWEGTGMLTANKRPRFCGVFLDVWVYVDLAQIFFTPLVFKKQTLSPSDTSPTTDFN